MPRNSFARSITTPKGTAVYPHLHAPDTKFQPEGVYSTKLKLSATDGAALLQTLEDIRESYRPEALKESKGKRLKEADLPVSENEDGSYTFNIKMKASGKTREGREWTQSPAIFDASGKVCPGLKIGGGSTLRVAMQAEPYFSAMHGLGVTLRLQAVQVVELQTFGERDASGFGFGAEEGGFSSASASESFFSTAEESKPDASGETSANDDF